MVKPQYFTVKHNFLTSLLILQAARDGDVQVMQKILESITTKKKRKVNELDENNLAPLHYAARYNHLEIAKLLVAHGAGKCAAVWMCPSSFNSKLLFILCFFWTSGNKDTRVEED